MLAPPTISSKFMAFLKTSWYKLNLICNKNSLDINSELLDEANVDIRFDESGANLLEHQIELLLVNDRGLTEFPDRIADFSA